MGGATRRFIRLAMADARSKFIEQTGKDWSPAEIQALLWYYEKAVHHTFGSLQTDENPDYASAANSLFQEERGTSEDARSYRPSDAVTRRKLKAEGPSELHGKGSDLTSGQAQRQQDQGTKARGGDQDSGPRNEGRNRVKADPKGAYSLWRGKAIQLTHWSRYEDVGETDPSYHGTMGAGAETKRKVNVPKEYLDRTYFAYGDYKREAQLGGNRHAVKTDGGRIYDWKKDPLDLYPDSDELRAAGYAPMDNDAAITIYEKRIHEAGFDGYVSTDFKGVAMFEKVSGLKALKPSDSTASPTILAGGKLTSGQAQGDREAAAERASGRMKTPKTEQQKKWENRDKIDPVTGEKVVKGDPSRANISGDQPTRNAYDVSSEIYEESRVQKNWKEYEAEAAILEKDPNAIEEEIFRRAEEQGQSGSGGFQIAAMRVVADRLQRAMASGDQADIDYAMALGQAAQEMKSEVGREMGAMRDPFKNPQQRAAYALGTAIHTAPPGQIRVLKQKHGAPDKGEGAVPQQNRAAYEEDVRKLQQHRVKEARKVLKSHGISVEEIFNAEKIGVGVGTAIDKEALKALSEKQQHIIQLFREGATHERGEAPPSGGASANPAAEVSKILDKSLSLGKHASIQKRFNIMNPNDVMAAFRALEKIDHDWVTRTIGTWYANVFSTATVLVNLMSLPFAGYRMFAEGGAEALLNGLFQNPEARQFKELKYLKRGLKEYFTTALWQAYVAFDTETAYFQQHMKGGGDAAGVYKGETSEEVRGYQMGHLGDYIDIGIEKAGWKPQRKSFIRSKVEGKKVMRTQKAGEMLRGVLRLNLGVDELMRFTIAGMEVGAIAYRIGKAEGLEGAELEIFVTQEMKRPGSRSWVLAGTQADISVFTNELPAPHLVPSNGVGGWLAGFMNGIDKTLKNWETDLHEKKVVNAAVDKNFTTAMRIDATRVAWGVARIALMPFTRVLMNLVQQGFRLVPNPVSMMFATGTLLKHSKLLGDGKQGPESAKAISRLSSQMLSTGIAYILMGAMEGDDNDDEKFILMTGSRGKFGKGAKAEREAGERKGMGPFKIRVGRGEDAIVFDYGRLDPLSTTLATTIDWIRESKKVMRGDKKAHEAAVSILSDTIVGQLTDKTMLRGINDTFKMLEGKMSVSKYAARQLATVLIPNLLRQPLRESNEFYDAPVTEKGLKGFYETVAWEMYPQEEGGFFPKNPVHVPPAKTDAFGNEMRRPEGWGDWILRQKKYTPNREDEMVNKARRLDPGNDKITRPTSQGKKYSMVDPSTGDSHSYDLTPKQYEILRGIYKSVFNGMRHNAINPEHLTKTVTAARKEALRIALDTPEFRVDADKASKERRDDRSEKRKRAAERIIANKKKK